MSKTITKKRIEEIRNSPDLSKQAEIEIRETIEEGNRISQENDKLFRGMLG